MRKKERNIIFLLAIYLVALLAPMHVALEDFSDSDKPSCELCDWIVSQKDSNQILEAPSSTTEIQTDFIVEKNPVIVYFDYFSQKTLAKGLFFRGPPAVTA